MLTKEMRFKNMSYFGELKRLLRFTFSTTNHRIFLYDCLAAHERYGAFVFCFVLFFVTEPSFSPRDTVLYCTNLHTALMCQLLYDIRLHLRYSFKELCTDIGLG
jgi:hypothetical protein